MQAERREFEGLSVAWATEYEGIGNSYGYSVQNARAREALIAAGVRLSSDAPVVVHVAPAHMFRPWPGRRNVLYMAWETEELPTAHRRGMAQADALVVTASFLAEAVRRELPDKPVYLCPLGVDTELYSFRRREKPVDRPFRFLWVGAPNARKGWELVIEAWRPFVNETRAELYLKTTVTDRFERHWNVIFDSRNLPPEEMAGLYHSAHAFIFPSFGEGFGLTLAEAMATGLPAIYTPWSSLNDLADERCAYPVRFDLVAAWATPEGGLTTGPTQPHPEAIRTRLAQADPADLAARMVQVFWNYARAAARGQKAARRIRERFTWDRTGRTLARIVAKVAGALDANGTLCAGEDGGNHGSKREPVHVG